MRGRKRAAWLIWVLAGLILGIPSSAEPDFSEPYSGVGPVDGEIPLLVVLMAPDDPHWHPTINIYARGAGDYIQQYAFETLNPTSKRVHFQTVTGHYLTSVGGGGGDVVATSGGSADPGVSFVIVDTNDGLLESGDPVYLETENGDYFVKAQGGGGGDVRGDGTAPDVDETFILRRVDGAGEVRHGDRITLETSNGHFIEAVGGGGGNVDAVSTSPGIAGTFTLRARQRRLVTRTLPTTHRFLDDPITVNSADGLLQSVFGLAYDARIYQTFVSAYNGDTAWVPWAQIPGSVTFSHGPAAINSPDGSRMHLFATGSDGLVYGIDFDRTVGAWGAWAPLSGAEQFQSAPTVLNTADGRYLRVFATASDGFIYERARDRFTATWGPWSRVPGSESFQFGPAAISTTEGDELQVFATGTDGHVRQITRAYSPANDPADELYSPAQFWGAWSALPQSLTFDSGPSAMNTADGELTVVQAMANDEIYEIAYVKGTDPRWGVWTGLDSSLLCTARPAPIHRMAPRRTSQAYRDDIFGANPSVRDYFLETSYNAFTYGEAYVTPWLTAIDDPATTDVDESTFEFLHYYDQSKKSSWLVRQVEDMTSFRFADYDTNGDGRIRQDELAILWVYPGDGDARGRGFNPNPVPVPSLAVGVELPLLVRGGARMSRGTIAHELAHETLNLPDLYPQVGFFSLMGYSGNISHLDPWTKMKSGWLDLTPLTSDGFYSLRAVEQYPEAFVLHRPGPDVDEYFILENRWPQGSYEEGLVDQGIAVWHIVERFENQSDWGRKTIHLISPDEDPGLWSGEFLPPVTLQWDDGTSTGITLSGFSPAGPVMTFSIDLPDYCGAGWEFVDFHPDNGAAASPTELVALREDGTVCRVDHNGPEDRIVLLRNNGEILLKDGLDLQLIDDNYRTVEIAVTDSEIYQRHDDGRVWRHLGGFRFWEVVDGYLDPQKELEAAPDRIFQIRGNGHILERTDAAGSWTLIDDNPASSEIAAGPAGAFQLHGANRRMWKYSGQGFRLWSLIDENDHTRAITVGDTVYQIHDTGGIFRAFGTNLDQWSLLRHSPETRQIVARDPALYSLQYDGTVLCFQSGQWTVLDSGLVATTEIFGSVGTLRRSSGQEVSGLAYRDSLNPDAISWIAVPGVGMYELRRSSARDFADSCVSRYQSGTVWVDTRIPQSGEVFHYLARPATPQVGSWGTNSDGVPREVPCH